MITKEQNPVNQKPAAYQRYSLSMRRGEWPNIESKVVENEDEEAAAVEAGWSTTCPPIPQPEEPKPEVTDADRWSAMEASIAALTTAMDDLQERTAHIKRRN